MPYRLRAGVSFQLSGETPGTFGDSLLQLARDFGVLFRQSRVGFGEGGLDAGGKLCCFGNDA
jgi:hypothetical protein